MELMILDGNSIVNRAFFGVRPLNAPDGTPTNAIFGFLQILRKLLDDYKPDALCVAFDVHAPTFRHLADDTYKAGRKPMPEELFVQMPILKKLLTFMGIKYYELAGYEADDILGTTARICGESGWTCRVVTGDRDSLQLVSPSTHVCLVKTRMGQTETTDYSVEVFEEEYGFKPIGIIDLKALMGDSSDNIPGVPGVGEKTAKELISKYKDIDTIYTDEVLSEIRDSVRKKLTAGYDSAYKSRWLATIYTRVPLIIAPEENIWHNSYKNGLFELMRSLGFTKQIEKWGVSDAPADGSSGNDAGEWAPQRSAEEPLPIYEERADKKTFPQFEQTPGKKPSGKTDAKSAEKSKRKPEHKDAEQPENIPEKIAEPEAEIKPEGKQDTVRETVSTSEPGAPAEADSEENEKITENKSDCRPACLALPACEITDDAGTENFLNELESAEYVSVVLSAEKETAEICTGKTVYTVSWTLSGENYNRILRAVFRPEVRKLSHYVKDLMKTLKEENLSCDGFVFDTALAAYLLDATASNYSLSILSGKYLDGNLSESQTVYELYPVLSRKLEENGMTKLFNTAELPLCEVLADMERKGFLVDRTALHDFGVELSHTIDVLQNSIWSHAGHEFNINSTKQLGTVLFEELMLPSGKKNKSGWSTNADVLEKLRSRHPIINEVLDYRMLTKLKSTYTDGLSKVIDADGRIHTNFQMTVTATGRLSSTEPNLQNIPIRKDVGAQIRKMFVAAPGCVLVDADYSQIELRLLSCIADDETMQNAFLSGEDFHRVTASKVFNIPLEEVTPQIRSRAKAVNFGIIYGISAFSLSQDIGVSTAEAKMFMDRYLDRFDGVRKYMDSAVKRAEQKGYAETLYGRRRYMPELQSPNRNIKAFGERVALNMPVQGTAADIIKLAMVAVWKWIKEEKLEARLILQVHDELIVECPENEAEKVKTGLKEIMEHVTDFRVPLIAEANTGKNWAEAH